MNRPESFPSWSALTIARCCPPNPGILHRKSYQAHVAARPGTKQGVPGMAETYRVLIVDDSPSMRQLLRLSIQADPRLSVVGEAENADQARSQVRQYAPDVLTLDAEMPGKSGLEFLAELMKYRPTPVVMFSSWMPRGSELGLEALSLGAVACLEKPEANRLTTSLRNLVETLVMAARATVRKTAAPTPPAQKSGGSFDKVLMVGASTGGVEAIETLLSGFAANCPATLITQHMPENFLKSFVTRLNTRMAPEVRLAEDGTRLAPGLVLIAPGGDVHLELGAGLQPRAVLVTGPKVAGHCPSVDRLFLSGLPRASRIVALLLTGMGRDGALGMKALCDAGAATLAQTEDSCVVYGMPRAAAELGAVQHWVSLGQAAEATLAQCRTGPRAATGS